MLRKILIADDSEVARNHLRKLLSFQNFLILEVKDGKEALDAIEKENPDLVLLDLNMPVMDGFEVLEKLSPRLQKEFLPIIVITGEENRETLEKAFQLGAVDFIVKPPSEVELKSRVSAHLRTKSYYEELLEKTRELELLMEELRSMSVTDPLTGLYNRLYFNEKFKEEFERARRLKLPFSFLMIDIDHFKKVNDTYGHDVGDKVLVATAGTIKGNVRAIDIVSRYGGEEFTVILLRTHREHCLPVAERIRKAVEESSVPLNGKIVRVTISIGCTTYSGEEDVRPEEVIKKADEALYMAKNHGRNRSVFLPLK